MGILYINTLAGFDKSQSWIVTEAKIQANQIDPNECRHCQIDNRHFWTKKYRKKHSSERKMSDSSNESICVFIATITTMIVCNISSFVFSNKQIHWDIAAFQSYRPDLKVKC